MDNLIEELKLEAVRRLMVSGRSVTFKEHIPNILRRTITKIEVEENDRSRVFFITTKEYKHRSLVVMQCNT